MNDRLRAPFERWVLGNGGSIDCTYGGEYRSAVTEASWDAWDASADYYALPDTHRIVSVGYLEELEATLRREGCGWTANEVRAIIDKERTE